MQRLVLIAMLASVALLPRSAARVVGSSAADSATIAVRTFQFSPERVEVEVGTRVVWSNLDQIEHTATSGSAVAQDSLFDLGLPQSGARAAFSFEKPGTYAYYCARHPFMRGEIRVTQKGE